MQTSNRVGKRYPGPRQVLARLRETQVETREPHRSERGKTLGGYRIVLTDAFEWLRTAQPCSVQAVVTDPPYGLIEYSPGELQKKESGRGGVWRIPPSFDGCQRKPLPRFTVLTHEDRNQLRFFFRKLADYLM